jgi:SHAQKYF class myb-like DNA-binding protein
MSNHKQHPHQSATTTSNSTLTTAVAAAGPIHNEQDHDNTFLVKRSASEASLVAIGHSASSSSLASKNDSSSYGRWTREEHETFLEGLKLHGREWKRVSEMIPTRTSAQIRSHAQKYFAKITKEGGVGLVASANHPCYTSATFVGKVEMIMKDPSRVEQEVESRLIRLHELHQKLQAKLARKKQKISNQSEKLKFSGADDDVKKLMVEAEKEMLAPVKQPVNKPLSILETSEGKEDVGPATAALASQAVYTSEQVASPAPVPVSTPPTVSQGPLTKKVKHSISNNEMIALEVLGTGALSTPTFGGRMIVKKHSSSSSQENIA